MYSGTMMVLQAIPDPIHFVALRFPYAAGKVVANSTVLTTNDACFDDWRGFPNLWCLVFSTIPGSFYCGGATDSPLTPFSPKDSRQAPPASLSHSPEVTPQIFRQVSSAVILSTRWFPYTLSLVQADAGTEKVLLLVFSHQRHHRGCAC